jgi:hypothetical protein
MSQIYPLPRNSRPYITGGIITLSILTFISAIILLTGDMDNDFSSKTVSIAFMSSFLNVSALSAAKHVTPGSPTYRLGIAGIIICELALSLFTLFALTEPESAFFIKLTFSLIVLSAAIGYISGIATIPGNSQEVKGLRITAIASVAGFAFLMVYGIFFTSGNLQNLGMSIMYGGIMDGLMTYFKAFLALLVLSLGLTLLTKLVSMIQYVPPPAADEPLFDYEREELAKAAAEKQAAEGNGPAL